MSAFQPGEFGSACDGRPTFGDLVARAFLGAPFFLGAFLGTFLLVAVAEGRARVPGWDTVMALLFATIPIVVGTGLFLLPIAVLRARLRIEGSAFDEAPAFELTFGTVLAALGAAAHAIPQPLRPWILDNISSLVVTAWLVAEILLYTRRAAT